MKQVNNITHSIQPDYIFHHPRGALEIVNKQNSHVLLITAQQCSLHHIRLVYLSYMPCAWPISLLTINETGSDNCIG